MNCDECQDFIDAYLDDELDASLVITVERHLRGCPECRQAVEARKSLRALLSRPQLRFELPDGLRTKVLSALPTTQRRTGFYPRGRFADPWFSVPLALAAALALALGVTLFYREGLVFSPQESALAAQVVSGHVRSLLAAHLLDVPSSDQHTVKPWFAGKLEFSPPVRDFTEHGFALVGGRLDYLDGQEVAALVYRRNKHIINLFIWPVKAGRTDALRSFAENGYNVLHWNQGGFSFWAVSDVRLEDLRAFADLEMQQP